MIITRGINSRIGRRAQLLGRGVFSPLSLFANGKNGVFFPITKHDGMFTVDRLFSNDENGVFFPITKHDGGA